MSELTSYYYYEDRVITPATHLYRVYHADEADKVIAKLKNKLQNVSSLLKETREWLVESQKLHKRCADNAVKVIAELQAQKAQAEDDCAYWKTLAQKKETMATINYNEKDLQVPLEELKNRFNRLCRQSENMIQIKADNNKEKSLTKETRWTQFFNKLRLTIRKTLDALKKSVKM
jgi:hypothetical protein